MPRSNRQSCQVQYDLLKAMDVQRLFSCRAYLCEARKRVPCSAVGGQRQ